MSDEVVGRYRRAYARIWRHPGFRGLTQAEQRVALYLLTGPQTNRIGLFHFSVLTASEDLDLGADTLRKALAKVCVTFGWMHDAEARVFYVPSHWRWNRPDHDKVLQGNLKDLSEIPPCGLADAFARNLTYLDPKLHETFVEAIRLRLPKGPSSQEQYQESVSGNQEQEPAALSRGKSLKSVPNPNHEKKDGTDGNRTASPDARIGVFALSVVSASPRNVDLDYLVDALINQCRMSGIKDCTRRQALLALGSVGVKVA